MPGTGTRALGRAAIAFAVLLGTVVISFAWLSWLSGLGMEPWRSPGEWFGRLDVGAISGTVASAAEVGAGVLAIASTVVAIVVELAANRYTHRITQLFVSEPVNVLVMGFFVLTTIQCVWIAAMVGGGAADGLEYPLAGLLAALTMVTICLLMLLPYFAFVFDFLSPMNIIDRIRGQAVKGFGRSAAGRIRPGRVQALSAIEELEDLVRGAMSAQDRGIAMAGVDALSQLVTDYVQIRGDMPEGWFEIDGALAQDPDFVSMDPAAIELVRAEKLWLETKILRQLLTLFGDSLHHGRDIGYLIAIETRQIGADAAHRGHRELLTLSIRFFNSYLRATLNARDLRSAYYVLHQYRLLCESVMEAGRDDAVIEIAGHFRFYGLLALTQKQPFLLEAVAYDLSHLVEKGVEAGLGVADPLLEAFLQVDKESESPALETTLRGVRRAQVQLATFFMERGDRERARRIWQDMSHERAERLAVVRQELLEEDRPIYWEFTDRGVNFPYLPPKQRRHVEEFFGWFGDRLDDGG